MIEDDKHTSLPLGNPYFGEHDAYILQTLSYLLWIPRAGGAFDDIFHDSHIEPLSDIPLRYRRRSKIISVIEFLTRKNKSITKPLFNNPDKGKLIIVDFKIKKRII